MATITRTARTLLEGSLRSIGVHGPAQDLDPEQVNWGLQIYNELLALVAIDPLLTRPSQESFTLIVGTQDYTIGSGGNFDTNRPKDVTGGYIRSGGNDYPLTARSRLEWLEIRDKDRPGRPDWFYFDPLYPLAYVRFESAPTAADIVYLDLQQTEGEITTLDTTITLPPEYMGYLRYAGAIMLAPEDEIKDTREVQGLANKFEKKIKLNNVPYVVGPVDSALRGVDQEYPATTDRIDQGV